MGDVHFISDEWNNPRCLCLDTWLIGVFFKLIFGLDLFFLFEKIIRSVFDGLKSIFHLHAQSFKFFRSECISFSIGFRFLNLLIRTTSSAKTDSNDVFQLNVDDDPQTVFDELYSVLNALLNQFYPIKKITVSNRDPYFMTPRIKCLLRVKNKLMRKGRVEKAQCISKRILKLIIAKNVSIFSPANPIKDTRDLWSRVNDITGNMISLVPLPTN